MNRIALRLSAGILAVVVLCLVAAQTFMHWHVFKAVEARVPAQEQLAGEALRLYLGTVAPEDRERTARELGRVLGVPVEELKLADLRISDVARKALGERGLGIEHRRPFEIVLLVRIPESDKVVRVGPVGPPIEPPVWPAVAMLVGLVLLVAVTGTLVARPFVRRLGQLQEASFRIAKGDLAARAPTSGHDALSDLTRHFNQMADRNQLLLEKQRDLMRAVSHELRTPAARIRFAVELFGDATSDEDRARHMAAIDSDLSEIDSLIQELLILDRLDSEPQTVDAERFDVGRAITGEIERLQPTRQEIALSMTIAPGEGVVAAGNERLFRRAVRNVLSNGARHARSKVRVSLSEASGQVLVRIDDDGPGIPAPERARVLEPFARLDPSRSRESGGFGLGLAIVDRILRAAGGQLEIGDADLGGARITLSWPVSRREKAS